MEQVIGTQEWLRMMSSLVLVLALAVGCLYGWRWLQNRSLVTTRAQRAQLRVEEAIQLGARHKVVLLRAGTQRLVVGISPQGFTRLAQWPSFESELQQQAREPSDEA